jgi:acyl carrier protein
MEKNEIQAIALSILAGIAPEVEPGAIDARTPLRDQVDLDSMDWLNFLVALHQRLKVEIPESDYARLVSLSDVVDYLHAKAA